MESSRPGQIQNDNENNVESSRAIPTRLAQISELRNGNPEAVGRMDLAGEDSPYGGEVGMVEHGAPKDVEESDSVASTLPSISASHSESKWGDTTPYTAKKVFCLLTALYV